MKLTRPNGGFTIVELLVVIVVIAILVALTLPNLFGLQRRARDDDRKNDLKNLQSALEEYYTDEQGYPATLAELDPVPSDETLNDPQGNAYSYAPLPASCASGACSSYTLTADLENDNDPQANATGFYEVKSVSQ